MQESIAEQVKQQIKQTEELIHQKRLGIMPSILVEISEIHLYAKNVGNGTALNVKFENTIDNKKLYSEDFNYKIENILILIPEETKEIKIHNKSVYKMPINWTGLRVPGTIVFQDVEGNNYQQILENFGDTGKLRYGFPVLVEQTKE